MAPPSDRAFVAKTHARLTELSAEAKHARRAHNKPGCICVNCSKVAQIHEQMNDYFDQLDEERQPTDLTSLAVAFHAPADETRVRARICSCKAQRYSDFNGFMWCTTCDFEPDHKFHTKGYDQLDTSDETE